MMKEHYVKLAKEKLSQQQLNIFTAIKTNNLPLFMDLGGNDKVDLNFCAKVSQKKMFQRKGQSGKSVNKDTQRSFNVYPIMTCVAKGKI